MNKMDTETQKIKIAVYDDKDKLLGYKADSFWNLDKNIIKKHKLKEGRIEPNLIKNLEHFLNEFDHLEFSPGSKIVVFPSEAEPNLKNSLITYNLIKEQNKYACIKQE